MRQEAVTLEALALVDDPAFVRQPLTQLTDEPRLADARLTRDQHGLAKPARDTLRDLPESVQFVIPGS